MAVTLFALPAYLHPRLPPYPTWFYGARAVDICIALRLSIARIAVGPLAELGGVSRALRTADMLTLLADGSLGRVEVGVAFVAGAGDSLLDWTIDSLIASPIGHGQVLLFLLEALGRILLLLLRLLLLGLSLGCLALGIAGAFLAAFVLAFRADFVDSISIPAVMTEAVHTHADGTLNALHASRLGCGGDPFM